MSYQQLKEQLKKKLKAILEKNREYSGNVKALVPYLIGTYKITKGCAIKVALLVNEYELHKKNIKTFAKFFGQVRRDKVSNKAYLERQRSITIPTETDYEMRLRTSQIAVKELTPEEKLQLAFYKKNQNILGDFENKIKRLLGKCEIENRLSSIKRGSIDTRYLDIKR